MSSAKRRINFTGRRRINRESIDIRVLEAGAGEPLKAKVSLNLDEFKFPHNAVVAIEAYHRSSGMRFDCGTIANLKIPPAFVLDQVDRSGSVLFRVRVIDNENVPGRILGAAERVQPKSEDDEDGKKSLFPVLFRPLGAEIWKVEIEYGDRPKLILNKEIPGIAHRLQNDALLQGFLLPAAFRTVLETLVKDPDDEDDDEPGWKAEWLQFCRDGLGMTNEIEKMDAEQKRGWIDDAIRKFCESYGFMDRIRKMEDGSEQ